MLAALGRGGACKVFDANRPRSLPPPVAALFRSPPLLVTGSPEARATNPRRTQKIAKKADAAASHDLESFRAASGTAFPLRPAPTARTPSRPPPPSPRPSHAREPEGAPAIPLESWPRPDHSVCTSTEYTAGKSRTIGAQLSPASAEQYTCPPLVPKYTPHLSSASTAIASRSTFT